LPKFATIAYNIEARLRFSTFNTLNIAKFGYMYLNDCHLSSITKLKNKIILGMDRTVVLQVFVFYIPSKQDI